MLSALRQFLPYHPERRCHLDVRYLPAFLRQRRMSCGALGVLLWMVAHQIKGASDFCDINLPGPTPYAFHTRIPSLEISIFESRLTPSILYVPIGGLVTESQRVTRSDGTPLGFQCLVLHLGKYAYVIL